jgi:hypothetical protein
MSIIIIIISVERRPLLDLLQSYNGPLTMGLIRRLNVTQRAMERAMLGVSLRDRIRDDEIR